MWFKNPHGAVVAVNGGRTLAFVAVAFFGLPFPGIGFLVVLIKSMVELARQPSDAFLVSGIRKTQTTRRQASEVDIR